MELQPQYYVWLERPETTPLLVLTCNQPRYAKAICVEQIQSLSRYDWKFFPSENLFQGSRTRSTGEQAFVTVRWEKK